jgi:hypothetical protein
MKGVSTIFFASKSSNPIADLKYLRACGSLGNSGAIHPSPASRTPLGIGARPSSERVE